MKEELKDWAISTGLLSAGLYARVKIGKDVYTIGELIAMFGVGICLILILDETSLNQLTKMSATLAYGIASKSLIRTVIKIFKKSEDKISDKASDIISDKLDDMEDKIF